jgi:hypothetical protein
MAHKKHCAALPGGDVLHFADGFFLELSVAYCEDFVHNEDFWL